MDVIIGDAEMLRGGRILLSLLDEMQRLQERYEMILNTLKENGFVDEAVAASITEKSENMKIFIDALIEANEGTMEDIYKFIDDVDETDQYLY